MSDLVVRDVHGVQIKIGDKVKRLSVDNGQYLKVGETDIVTEIATLDDINFGIGSIDRFVYTSKFPLASGALSGNWGSNLEVLDD